MKDGNKETVRVKRADWERMTINWVEIPVYKWSEKPFRLLTKNMLREVGLKPKDEDNFQGFLLTHHPYKYHELYVKLYDIDDTIKIQRRKRKG